MNELIWHNITNVVPYISPYILGPIIANGLHTEHCFSRLAHSSSSNIFKTKS